MGKILQRSAEIGAIVALVLLADRYARHIARSAARKTAREVWALKKAFEDA